MKNHKFGVASILFSVVALLMTAYTVSSIEMKDGLTETPEYIMKFSMLFISHKAVGEPSCFTTGVFPLIDEDKRYYAKLLSYMLLVLGTISALTALHKKEHSLFYSTGFFATGSTFVLLSVKAFVVLIITLAIAVGLTKKYHNIKPGLNIKIGGAMTDSTARNKLLAYIAVAVFCVVFFSYFLFKVHHFDKAIFSLMIVSVGLITYFGFFMLPGGFAEKSGFSESRIRLAITSTLFITYIVYWGTIIVWSKEGLQNSYNQKLFETLTDL